MKYLCLASLCLLLTGCTVNLQFYQPAVKGSVTTIKTVDGQIVKVVDYSNISVDQTTATQLKFGKKTFHVGALKSIQSVTDYSIVTGLVGLLQ